MIAGETPVSADSATDSANRILYELDLLTGNMKWSQALYTLFGYQDTEPFKRLEWWIEHIHPDDAMMLNQAMDQLLVPTIPKWTVEYRFRKGNNSYVMVRDQASIIRDTGGQAVRLIGTLTPLSPVVAQAPTT